MDITNAIEAIQAILAPAVLISACGLLLLSMQNKYGRINDRIRTLLRERLDLLAEPENQFTLARLEAIDRQLPELLQRNRLQHDAVLALFWAVILFVIDLFALGIGLFFAPRLGAILALLGFFVALGLMLYAVLLAAQEIRISHRAVTLEAEGIMKVSHPHGTGTPTTTARAHPPQKPRDLEAAHTAD
jgi:hypothetical protein